MKKLIALILAVMFLLSILVACGAEEKKDETKKDEKGKKEEPKKEEPKEEPAAEPAEETPPA